MFFWKIIFFCLLANISYSQLNSPELLWRKANSLPSSESSQKLDIYKKAANFAKKQNNFAWQANICPDICGAYFSLGEYDNALKTCIEGLKIIKIYKIHTDSISFKLHSSLATCYNKMYRIQDALREFEIANNILIKKPEVLKQSSLFAAYHFSNQAYMLLSLFEIENAKVFYEKALDISISLPSKRHHAVILSNLSQYYRFLGQPEKGIEKLETAFRVLPLHRELDSETISNMYFMLAFFYHEKHNFKAATFNYYKSILYANKDKKINENKFRAYNYLAKLFSENSQNQKAFELLKSIDFRLISDKEIKFEYFLTFGDYYAKIKQEMNAIKFYERAFQACFPDQDILKINPKEVFQYRFRLYEILGRMSNTWELIAKKDGSIAHLERGYLLKKKIIALGNVIRSNQENLDSKLFFTDKYHKHYTEAISLGYELYKNKPTELLALELFELAEDAKSIALADNLLFNSRKRDPKTDSLMAKLNAYQSYQSYLKNQDYKDSVVLNEYSLKIINIIKELKNTNKAIYSSIFLEKRLTNLTIPKHSIYFNYIIFGSDLYVFCKTEKKIIIQKNVLNKTEFKENVLKLTKAIQNPPGRFEGFEENKLCVYFYDKLLNGFKYELSVVDRIIVNPDNSFYGVSFDILQNPFNGRFLIESHAISYANSLAHIKGNYSENKTISKKWKSFFPFSSSTQKLISGLKPLKFSLKEIKGILTDIKKDHEATKKTFLEDLNRSNNEVIMIATHAKSNDSDPYLIFDEKDQVSSRLYASEIRHNKVNSPMVILSECETNKGKTFNGLGVLSFAKSLSWAGCPTVVGTFWEVDDKSMSALASLFYRNLMKGMEKDVALQKAKLSYLHSDIGKLNDPPFYWAHLQVIGDTKPIASSFFSFYWLLAITFCFALIYYFRNQLKSFFSARVVS